MVESLEAYYEAVPEHHRETVRALRALVLDCYPEAAETLEWNQPTFAVDGRDRVYVAWYTDHVNLGFFRGAEVDDPDGRLEGTGKAMRHVSFADADEVNDPVVRALVVRAA